MLARAWLRRVESYVGGSMLARAWLHRVGDVDTRSRMLLAVASMRLSAQRLRLLQVRVCVCG